MSLIFLPIYGQLRDFFRKFTYGSQDLTYAPPFFVQFWLPHLGGGTSVIEAHVIFFHENQDVRCQKSFYNRFGDLKSNTVSLRVKINGLYNLCHFIRFTAYKIEFNSQKVHINGLVICVTCLSPLFKGLILYAAECAEDFLNADFENIS